MKTINENVIVATSREMIANGLADYAQDDRIILFHYQKNIVWEKMDWAPMIELFAEPVIEDILNDRGEVITPRSTHKIDDFYGAPVGEVLDMRKFLAKIGVTVEPLAI